MKKLKVSNVDNIDLGKFQDLATKHGVKFQILKDGSLKILSQKGLDKEVKKNGYLQYSPDKKEFYVHFRERGLDKKGLSEMMDSLKLWDKFLTEFNSVIK